MQCRYTVFTNNSIVYILLKQINKTIVTKTNLLLITIVL